MADARENLQETQRRESNARENLQETQRRESRSMKDTKGRSPDSGLSESDGRNDRRHKRDPKSGAEKKEKEDSGLRIKESGQVRDHKKSWADIQANLQQQRLKDAEMPQRRSHETKSRFLPLKKRGRNPDLGPSESDDRTDQRHKTESIYESGQISDHKESYADMRLTDVEMHQRRNHETESRFLPRERRATDLDWGSSQSEWKFDERSQTEYQRVCPNILERGLCNLGRLCLFRHPRCKYFLRGACEKGSACKFLHPKDRDGAEPMRQAGTWDWRYDERRHKRESSSTPEKRGPSRHETESVPTPEKRDKSSPYSRDRSDTRERIHDISQRHREKDWVFNLEKRFNKGLGQICEGIVAGFKREKMEKEQGQVQGNLQEQRQRENTEWQKREAQENVLEEGEVQDNLQEQRQTENTEWQRREAQDELEQGEIQGNLQEQRQRENTDWQRREAQEIVQEQTQRDTEMQRREAKESLEEKLLEERRRRNEKESVLKLEKRFNRSLSQICDGIVAGIMRERMEREQGQVQDSLQEQRQSENTEWQSREAQEDVQEETQRDTETQRREAEENLEEQRLMNLDEERQRDMERQKIETGESVEEKMLKAKTILDSDKPSRVYARKKKDAELGPEDAELDREGRLTADVD